MLDPRRTVLEQLERIERGLMPADEAFDLELAVVPPQVAYGMESLAAHRGGIWNGKRTVRHPKSWAEVEAWVIGLLMVVSAVGWLL
jgi:hypothetical protein